MEKISHRLENLLALILINQMKGATMRDKAVQLSLAGLSNVEIADFLETTGPAISQLLYEARKTKKKKKAIS